MGWWRTGNHDDLIGDGPADTLTGALQDFTELNERHNRGKPSLPEVLSAVLKTLSSQPQNYICDSQNHSLNQIIAKLDSDKTVTSDPNADSHEEAISIFHDAFEDIAVEYQDSELARKPRLSELLAALQFVLGDRPEAYISDLEGASISSIEV